MSMLKPVAVPSQKWVVSRQTIENRRLRSNLGRESLKYMVYYFRFTAEL